MGHTRTDGTIETSVHETVWRTTLKTMLYRGLMILTTLLVTFAFTERLDVAVAVGLTANAVKTVTYFSYERLWSRIPWGLLAAAKVRASVGEDLPPTSPRDARPGRGGGGQEAGGPPIVASRGMG
jgi:uncharacterized membrane protein